MLVAHTTKQRPARPLWVSAVAAAALLVGAVGSTVPSSAQAQTAYSSGSDAAYGQQQLRIAELERLVQELTGKVEEAQFRNAQLAKKLDQVVGDVDFRLKQLESNSSAGGGAASSVAPAGSAPAQPAAPPAAAATPAKAANGQQQAGVFGYIGPNGAAAPSAAPAQQQAAAPAGGGLPNGTPEQKYNYAFDLLRKNNYAAAEGALKAFVQQNPTHELAGNAQYWLGETYYVRGDFKQAAVAFLDGYRNYPKSAKGADNLLKLGLTMGSLNQNKEACAAFGKLSSDYPQAPDTIKRKAQQERERLNCK